MRMGKRKPVLDAIEQNDSLYSMWEDDSIDDREIDAGYRRFTLRKYAAIIVCIIATIIAAGLAITYGPYDISFLEVYQIIWDHMKEHAFGGGAGRKADRCPVFAVLQ